MKTSASLVILSEPKDLADEQDAPLHSHSLPTSRPQARCPGLQTRRFAFENPLRAAFGLGRDDKSEGRKKNLKYSYWASD